MKAKFIEYYYDFFDKKIWNSSIVVGLIWLMIFLAWFLLEWTRAYKASLLDYNSLKYDNKSYYSVVSINWKKYKVIFQEIK